MNKCTSYIISAIGLLMLALPAQATVMTNSSSKVNAIAGCSSISPNDTALAQTAERSYELAMDTDDAILTGVLGAAVIGAAIIANNNHHETRTIVVEQQAPPPPPRPIIVERVPVPVRDTHIARHHHNFPRDMRESRAHHHSRDLRDAREHRNSNDHRTKHHGR